MSHIRLETDGKIAVVTLDRAPVNALGLDNYQEVGDVFADLSKREDLNVVVLTGGGAKAFSAGLDMNEFMNSKVEDDQKRAIVVRRMFATIRACPIPVIGAINGPALGAGCVTASVCDFRIASENAKFGLPEVNIGRCGGTAHMGRHLPQGLLRMMFFTGQPISAQEAYRVGFVQEVVAQDALMPRAMEMARLIAEKAPLGLRHGKASMNQIEYLPVEEGYAIEQMHSTMLMHSHDAREATRAFVEKRKPVYTGR